ncbi:hypothetical protein C8R45DRAFT_1095450 [Mycena sanguinolenta]|nr:hypothetical protein C8R45DRAFT_1095450 [Mycena sanguinolenta]
MSLIFCTPPRPTAKTHITVPAGYIELSSDDEMEVEVALMASAASSDPPAPSTQTPQGLNTNTATYADMPAFVSETSFDFTDVNFQLPRASISFELPILPSLPASSPPIASELPPPVPKHLRRPEVDAANIITSSRVRVPSKRVLDGDHTEQRPQKKKKSQSTLFRFDACLR